jgi:hypothetical protein
MLLDFVQNKMRMSHIYQPVMLMTLIKGNGKCQEREIAKPPKDRQTKTDQLIGFEELLRRKKRSCCVVVRSV